MLPKVGPKCFEMVWNSKKNTHLRYTNSGGGIFYRRPMQFGKFVEVPIAYRQQ